MNTYNNWKEYYELNLQLHNKVSNPYTFNIDKNYNCYSNIKSQYNDNDYNLIIQVGEVSPGIGYNSNGTQIGSKIKDTTNLNVVTFYYTDEVPGIIIITRNNYGKRLTAPQLGINNLDLSNGMVEIFGDSSYKSKFKALIGQKMYINLIRY